MKKNSLKVNLLYNISYQILVIIMPLITSPYISRVLGAEVTGIYSYTYSVANYFLIFAGLGIATHAQRTIARVRDDKEELNRAFSNLYFMQLIMAVLLNGLYVFYVIIFVNDDVNIALIQSLLVLSHVFDITWFFFGIEEFKTTVTRNTIIKIVSFISILVFVKSKDDLPIYTIILSGGILLGQLLLWPKLIKNVRFVKLEFQYIKKQIKPCLILFIPVLAISVFTMMDKVMLGNLSSMEQVGFYENSDKIISVPKSVIRALGVVMLPRITNMIANGKEKESKQYFETTIIFVIFASSAFAFGISAVSSCFSVVFWGEDFVECGGILSVLSIALIFSVIGNVIRTQYIIPNCKDNEYTLSLVLGAIVNLITNYFLIQLIGGLGAAVGTLIAEFTMTSVQIWIVRKKIKVLNYLKSGIPFILIGVFMFVCVKSMDYYMDYSIVNLFIEVIVGGTIFLFLSFYFMKKSKNESVSMFWKMISDFLKNIFKKSIFR